MSQVCIMDCDSYDLGTVTAKLDAGIAHLGGWDKFVQPGQTVLLKVNLIGPKPPESAGVTHCKFVQALTRLLHGRGCRVWIGDSSGGAIAGIAPTAQAFAVSGLEAVAAAEGATIKNFDREGVIEAKRASQPEEAIYLARPLFDADVVINLPKLKTHSAGIYTGAVKNVFGCIPGLRKAEYHKQAPEPREFGRVLADIHAARPLNLHIMDAIMAMEGEGPTAGKPYPARKILFSADPLALDTVAAAMIGLSLTDIPILTAARESGLGEADLATITVTGDYSQPPRLTGFRLPARHGSTRRRNNRAVIRVIDFLKSRPRINLQRCQQCNLCVESCPVQAIDRDSKRIDYSRCIECLCCHELCRSQAVELRHDHPLAGWLMRWFGRHH